MRKQEEDKKVVVPFNQGRLLILSMEAAKNNDQKKIEEIRKEAESLGIQMKL